MKQTISSNYVGYVEPKQILWIGDGLVKVVVKIDDYTVEVRSLKFYERWWFELKKKYTLWRKYDNTSQKPE